MQLAILFWCYKELELCADRVEHLRADNPKTPIYVLFGGELAEAEQFEQRLRPWVDDFYAFDEPPPPIPPSFPDKFRDGVYWKYMWGDLLIASWYRNRGVHLEFDTVVIAQWDMLIYGPVDEVFSCLQPGQALFSGLRPVREVEDRWVWVTPDLPEDRNRYLDFLAHVRERYGFDGEPMCCVAIVLGLPRQFLARFAQVDAPTMGFLEYRLPIYAAAFGIPFCLDHPFKAWWGTDPYSIWSTLRARPREIWAPAIFFNTMRRTGARVFHPYWRKMPRGFWRWTVALADCGPRLIIDSLARAWRRALPGAQRPRS